MSLVETCDANTRVNPLCFLMLAVLGCTLVCFYMTILELLSIHLPSDLDASPPQPSDLQFQFLHLQLQHLLLCDELLFLSR